MSRARTNLAITIGFAVSTLMCVLVALDSWWTPSAAWWIALTFAALAVGGGGSTVVWWRMWQEARRDAGAP